MSEQEQVASKPKKAWYKRKWLWVVAAIPLLLVVGYFVVASSAFFTAVVLPQVGNALGAKVTVGDAVIRPFSQADLKQLKVETGGAEPLITVQQVRLQYDLWDIIRGKMNVSELSVLSPVVQIVYNPDGTSNLDPIFKPRERKAPATPKEKGSKPTQLDLRNLTLKNATVRIVKNLKGGGRETTEIANADFSLSRLANGQPGSLTAGSDLKFERKAGATNDLLQGRITAKYEFSILPELRPQNLNGAAKIDVLKGEGVMKDFAGFSVAADADVTPTEIKQAALRFVQSGKNLGEVSLSGPFDPVKTEGKLRVEVRSVDRQVLNLFGATRGLDFGSTMVTSTNEIELGQGGSLIVAKGNLTALKFSVTNTTPPLDLILNYHTAVDRQKQSALIETFTLSGTQNQKPLLTGSLSKPMKVVWAKSSETVEESTFRLDVTKLNLADWRAFVGDYAGIVSLNLNVVSQSSGKRLQLDLGSQIEGLQVTLATNKVVFPSVGLQLNGRVEDFKQVTLNPSRLQIGSGDQPALVLTASGRFDRGTKEVTGEIAGDVALVKLSTLLPRTLFSASAGTVKLQAQYSQKGKQQKAIGNFVLTDFSGRYADYRFERYGVAGNYDVEIKEELALLRSLKATIQEGAQVGGTLDASGEWDLAKKSGQLDFKTMSLNERAVRPFLETALGNKKLVSVALSANASARYDARGETALKGDFQVAKLTVIDPERRLPGTPLEARFQLDAVSRNQLLDLRQCQITLSPTYRAKNEIRLAGNLDLTKTNAVAGRLKLAADSVDVTPYYDLFAGSPTNPPPANRSPTEAPAPPTNAEPAAKNFPFHELGLDLKLDRFYLRDLAITNWQAAATVDGGRVVLKPCTLTLNGAPVNLTADLNLGVPGYQYDLMLRAAKVPVAPLANSFSADYRGKAQGDLLASVQIKGAGTTGASWQKNLTGQVDLVFTNANIQLVGPKAKMLITPIAFVLRLDELTKSPVNWASADVKLGDGKIHLTQVQVVSEAFRAETRGEIPIAAVFTNSPLKNLPLDFYLRRSIANAANLMPADTPTNAPYVKLPAFVKIGGTIGHPESKTDALVITALIGRSAIGLSQTGAKAIQKVTGEANKVVPGLGDLLTGGKSSNTNQPGTNKPARFNPLDLLKPKKK